MSEQVIWSEISLEVSWGVLRGKKCITGNARATTTLQVFGLHGWLDNANTFDGLVPLLTPGVEVFVLDFPGHGFSGHLPNGAYYDVMSYVINVRAVVMELGWKSFVFLTHSLGALVGCYYTAMFPQDVKALIQFDYIRPRSSVKDLESWRGEINHILKTEQSRKPFNVYSKEKASRILAASRMARSEKDVESEAKSYALLLPRSSKQVEGGVTWIHDRKAFANFDSLYARENFIYTVSHIKCPVLIICSINGYFPRPDHNDEIVLNTYRMNCPKFVFEVVDGDHHAHLTHPEGLYSIVNTFLMEVISANGTGKVKCKL